MDINPETGGTACFMKLDAEMFRRQAEARFIEQRQHQRRHQQTDIPLRPEGEQRFLFTGLPGLVAIDMVGIGGQQGAQAWVATTQPASTHAGRLHQTQEIQQMRAQGGDFFPNTSASSRSAVGSGARQMSSSLKGTVSHRFPDTNLNDNDF
jgi:hypothetical protein